MRLDSTIARRTANLIEERSAWRIDLKDSGVQNVQIVKVREGQMFRMFLTKTLESHSTQNRNRMLWASPGTAEFIKQK